MKLDGKDMRMWYFLHHDFSVNSNRNPYCLRYRTKSEDVLELLSLWFRKWYYKPITINSKTFANIWNSMYLYWNINDSVIPYYK